MGAIYLTVRGLDNLNKGLKSNPDWKALRRMLHLDRPCCGRPIAVRDHYGNVPEVEPETIELSDGCELHMNPAGRN